MMYCEINLNKPSTGDFVGVHGNTISGVIKYVLNYPVPITLISASLEGSGTLEIEYLQRKDDEGNPEREIRRENYLDVNIVSQTVEDLMFPHVHEIPFSVEIPYDIPPSLYYQKNGLSHNITCKIIYQIQIAFIMPHPYEIIKRLFRKEINIISGLVPRLPMTSIIHEGEKKLTQLFSSKKSYVKVKANIYNSVLRCGEQIQIEYEVINDTNIVIAGIKAKLVEVYTFKTTDGAEIVMEEKVPGTDSKTESLESGETLNSRIDINVPVDRESLDFADIASRLYFVLITVKLPMPHRNYDLKIPVQIGNTPEAVLEGINGGCEWLPMSEVPG